MDQKTKEISIDERWEIIKKHYLDTGIKFERVPNREVINHLYENLLKFNANYILHCSKNPKMEERLIEASKKRRLGRSKLRIV